MVDQEGIQAFLAFAHTVTILSRSFADIPDLIESDQCKYTQRKFPPKYCIVLGILT